VNDPEGTEETDNGRIMLCHFTRHLSVCSL